MKKALLVLFLLFSSLARAETIDRVLAIVNNDVITWRELLEEENLAKRQLALSGVPLPPEEALRRQLLEKMVVELVQLQAAKKRGIDVSDGELESACREIAQQNGMDLPSFSKTLARDGISFAAFQKSVKKEIILSRLKMREIEDRVSVSELEVDNYLKNISARKGGKRQVHLRHIHIAIPEDAGEGQREKARSRAQEIYRQIEEGADFGKLAASYSNAATALSGGDFGWRDEDTLPDAFAQALQNLKAGEAGPPIETANGFHIIKLTEVKGGGSLPEVTQVHARHILIRPSELLSEDEARAKINLLRQRINAGEDFGEIARQYSEDSAAERGGDLGWLSPGDTVPIFERALQVLPVGEVSQPIRTQFGWHLIQVLGKRSSSQDEEAMREVARRAIRRKKAEEAYLSWAQSLRGEAYVEYLEKSLAPPTEDASP